MSDSNRPDGPAGDGALSFDEGADAIADVLDPNEFSDLDEPDESIEADETDLEEGDEPETDEVDSEDVDSPDEESEGEDEDGPEEPDSIDDQLVTMDDGSKITVRELRTRADDRIRDMQRTFTQKTTELSEQRKRVEADAQALNEQRDFLANWFQSEMPQEPDPSLMDTDFVGYMQQKDAYDRKVAKWQQMRQHYAQQHQQQQAESQKKAQEILAKERDAMLQAMPHLKDQKRFAEFRDNVMDIGTSVYGLAPEEIAGITDHRYLKALNDLVAFQKLKRQTKSAKKAVEGKPKVLTGSKRQSQKTSRSAKARADRLKQTGSFEAGVASLMDFDL